MPIFIIALFNIFTLLSTCWFFKQHTSPILSFIMFAFSVFGIKIFIDMVLTIFSGKAHDKLINNIIEILRNNKKLNNNDVREIMYYIDRIKDSIYYVRDYEVLIVAVIENRLNIKDFDRKEFSLQLKKMNKLLKSN